MPRNQQTRAAIENEEPARQAPVPSGRKGSSFNAEAFLNTHMKGKLDTKYPVCPEGDFRGQIAKLDAREQEIKKGRNAGSVVTILDITWEILDEKVRKLLGDIDFVSARQSVWLELTAEGQLDLGKGKNVALGRVREPLGLNDDSDFYLNMLLGCQGIVSVEHQDNEKDPETPYANVKAVAPLE